MDNIFIFNKRLRRPSGAWVDENSKLIPNSEKGKTRLEIEKDGKNYQKIIQYKFSDLQVFIQKKKI